MGQPVGDMAIKGVCRHGVGAVKVGGRPPRGYMQGWEEGRWKTGREEVRYLDGTLWLDIICTLTMILSEAPIDGLFYALLLPIITLICYLVRRSHMNAEQRGKRKRTPLFCNSD